MGSSSSKTTKLVAGAAKRRYPQQVPQTGHPASQLQPELSKPSPIVHPHSHASGVRDEAINLDASDPNFAKSLRSLGAVQPTPTFSNTSMVSRSTSEHQGLPGSPQASYAQIFPDPSSNPAIQILSAREKLVQGAEKEFLRTGKKGHGGRRFLDIVTIRQILMLRDEKKVEEGEIETRLGLEKGIVARLGPKGLVGDTSTGGL